MTIITMISKHEVWRSGLVIMTEPCAQCGQPCQQLCSFCNKPLCSRQKNPKCYYEHSQDMVSIENQQSVPFAKRHTLNGVNPQEFIGDSANQGSQYGQESGPCLACTQESTKRCRHCRQFICRPSENSGLCMPLHLRGSHGVDLVFGIS